MRVAPRELRGVRRDGVLVRFAMLGPVAYVEVEIPPGGSAGTGFEAPSSDPGWGFVLRGQVTLHGLEVREIPAGTAFYLPPGPPEHHLTARGGTIVAGFAPVAADLDTSDRALRRQGFEPVRGAGTPAPLPRTIRPMEPGHTHADPGEIDVETAPMGEWLFTRATFGPMSGYTSGWCDLPHWGLVLRGDFTLNTEAGAELMSAGDVFYVPPGPPGHSFQVPDAATVIDYTPIGELRSGGRRAEWRWTAWRDAVAVGDVPAGSTVAAEASGSPAQVDDRSSSAGTASGAVGVRPADVHAPARMLGPSSIAAPASPPPIGTAGGVSWVGRRWSPRRAG